MTHHLLSVGTRAVLTATLPMLAALAMFTATFARNTGRSCCMG